MVEVSVSVDNGVPYRSEVVVETDTTFSISRLDLVASIDGLYF
jgi:hypothetical protein